MMSLDDISFIIAMFACFGIILVCFLSVYTRRLQKKFDFKTLIVGI